MRRSYDSDREFATPEAGYGFPRNISGNIALRPSIGDARLGYRPIFDSISLAMAEAMRARCAPARLRVAVGLGAKLDSGGSVLEKARF